MAVIIDPDGLTRDQVIFGTLNSKVSLYPLTTIRGNFISSPRTDGACAGSNKIFTSTTGDFVTQSVVAGDILVIKNKENAGHYVIKTRDSATQLTLEDESFVSGTVTGDFVAMTGATYRIYQASLAGLSITDGVTMQCLYSYAKEEWRADSELLAGDNLIRYTFPIEAITSEQFEIGGGSSHGTWEYHNNYTRKKVRTGGFASKSGVTTRNEWTGIVTLGSLDSDAQIYYQQTDANTVPTNFTFLGPVNEPIPINTNTGAQLYKTYLKLFARKKARTYSQATIGDIGVSSIQTIVNRFPLAHAVDTGITASDAEILGTAPFRNQTQVTTGVNGTDAALSVVTAGYGTITSAGSTFLGNVVIGDVVKITEGTNLDIYFTITGVTNTVLTVSNSEALGDFSSGSALTFQVYTSVIVADKTTATMTFKSADTGVADVSTVTGTLTDSTASFITGGVNVNDLLIIKDTSHPAFNGIYKVISRTATALTVDTTDNPFTAQANIEYIVVEPGMYLEYKSKAISLGTAATNMAFDNALKTITKTGGDTTFQAAGVTAGTIITFTAAEDAANIKSFTVLTAVGNVITTIASDTMTTNAADTTAVSPTAADPFKRTIGTTVYGFHWKVTGNDSTLANIYQFIQHQLRQTTDIDWGVSSHRGDVTDLLMSYAAPTGTSLDLYIDNLAATDKNSITLKDATGVNRTNPYVASGTLSFNTTLVGDTAATYWLFFTTLPASKNYGTTDAIIVNNAAGTPLTGIISAVAPTGTLTFDFDYDGNIQGGRTPGEDAAVTLVAIGLETAQFVIATGTIGRSTGNSIGAVASLERNYSNLA